MSLTNTEKIDLFNILLMLVSAFVAMLIPFELFLFVYAILGPLHYLTEISWLHDRGYFTKGRYDALWLLFIGFALILVVFSNNLELEFPLMFDSNLMFIAVISSLLFVTVKNTFYKIGGIILIVFASKVGHNYNYLLTVFVPTLIHVYVFTVLFIVFGTIKSRSRIGLLSVVVMFCIPFALLNLFPDNISYKVQEYSKQAYMPFKVLNMAWFYIIENVTTPSTMSDWDNRIFHSAEGILLMRFIAFAYTYHYLNWFSKTKIIQWHKVPRFRFVLVIIAWLGSIAMYMYNYFLGMQWLLFLSFAHVLLELPLNFISIIGIGRYIKSKVLKSTDTIVRS